MMVYKTKTIVSMPTVVEDVKDEREDSGDDLYDERFGGLWIL